jgi:competence protein ComFC
MENFLHYLLLNKCYLCDQKGEPICSNCLSTFKPILSTSSKFLSLFEYNEVAKKLLYLSKYPPYYFYLLKYLIRLSFEKYQNDLLPFFNDFSNNSVLCPVPLSNQKLFERTFNQAEIISESLEELLKIPSINLIKRTKNTLPLYELNKDQRRDELKDAFDLTFYGKFLKPSEVIIIDDLYTTKQTLLNCAKLLSFKEVIRVKFFTLFSKK